MNTKIIFLLLLVFLLTGCSTNISSTITPPTLIAPVNLQDLGKGAMVFVDEVKDERGDTALGHGPNGSITSGAAIESVVRGGLEDLFKKTGFNVTDSAPVVLQVSLQKWDVNVSEGMSRNVDSSANLIIQVIDPANRLAYTGKYKGNSQIQQGSVDDKVVKEALTSSMIQLFEQISKDKNLMNLLSAY